MHTLNWLLRWILWLPSILFEFNRRAAPPPSLFWQAAFIQLGCAALVLVFLSGYVFLSHIGADILPWFLVAFAIYLIIGLVFYFFTSPKTRAGHDWRERGAW